MMNIVQFTISKIKQNLCIKCLWNGGMKTIIIIALYIKYGLATKSV